MLFLSSERLNLIQATFVCDCNNSPDYVHVPKSVTNGFWHSILKTMLLSEAWPEEFQLGIIRKHINHNSWNIYDNSHTPHNLLAAFHCFRVLFFLGRTVYPPFPCLALRSTGGMAKGPPLGATLSYASVVLFLLPGGYFNVGHGKKFKMINSNSILSRWTECILWYCSMNTLTEWLVSKGCRDKPPPPPPLVSKGCVEVGTFNSLKDNYIYPIIHVKSMLNLIVRTHKWL